MGVFGDAMARANNRGMLGKAEANPHYKEPADPYAGTGLFRRSPTDKVSIWVSKPVGDNDAWRELRDDYHSAEDVLLHISALFNALKKFNYTSLDLPVELDNSSMENLYKCRVSLFLTLMGESHMHKMDCGWSRKHSDGDLCFGGGWCVGWITTPSGRQARYHFEDNKNLPRAMEKDKGSAWNGKEETLDALAELC